MIVFVPLLLMGCPGGNRMRISQDELFALIQNGNAPSILDVRSRREFEAGHVPGAIHLPFYSLWKRHSEIEASKQDSIVVYCEHGPRAGLAVFALQRMGYEQVLYLDGHMSAWKKKGLPVTAGIP